MSRIIRRTDDREIKTTTLGIIGKIKIGEIAQSQNGKSFPKALDYFRCDAVDIYKDLFYKANGNEPKILTIVFPSNDIAECCNNYYELRDSAGKRVATGDGIHFKVATKQSDGMVKDIFTTPTEPQKWMDDLAANSKGSWKEVLTLRFVIPNIPIFGMWEFRTLGDDSSIPSIVGVIDSVMKMAGRISMIPFDLSVKMVKSDKAGSSSKYPVVSLIANVSQESIEKIRMLPDGITTLLTESTVKGLAQSTEADILEVQEMSAAMIFLDNYIIRNITDLNEALEGVKKWETSHENKKEAALILNNKALELGASYDKNLLKYR